MKLVRGLWDWLVLLPMALLFFALIVVLVALDDAPEPKTNWP